MPKSIVSPSGLTHSWVGVYLRSSGRMVSGWWRARDSRRVWVRARATLLARAREERELADRARLALALEVDVERGSGAVEAELDIGRRDVRRQGRRRRAGADLTDFALALDELL